MTSRGGGLKIVDGNNHYIYWFDRKYSDKTNQKWEIRHCKARLHAVLEDDNISVCKSFGDLKIQSWTHISRRTLGSLTTDMQQYAKNKWHCRVFHNSIQSSSLQACILVFGNWYLSLNEGRNISQKEKVWCQTRRQNNKQNKQRYKILWTKDWEDKGLDATHKIKSVSCTVLPWMYTHFKCIQILQ